jgi:hypothetical protein
MKKTTLKLLFATAAAFAGTLAQAEPSRLFAQELGEVSKDLSVDLDYATGTSNGLAAGVRVGAFGGEVLVNSKNELDLARSGFDAPNVGYKRTVGRGIALYGILSYKKEDPPGPGANPPARTNFAIGGAYTVHQRSLILTVNPEYVTDDGNTNNRGDENTLFIKAGVGYILSQRYGRVTLIGEVIGENNDNLDTVLNLGVR